MDGETISSMITTYFLYIENSLGVNLAEAYSCHEKQKSMLFYHGASLFQLEIAESIAFGAISAELFSEIVTFSIRLHVCFLLNKYCIYIFSREKGIRYLYMFVTYTKYYEYTTINIYLYYRIFKLY